MVSRGAEGRTVQGRKGTGKWKEKPLRITMNIYSEIQDDEQQDKINSNQPSCD
jgi:hypothetical protein